MFKRLALAVLLAVSVPVSAQNVQGKISALEEALGAFSGQGMYLLYISIGATADGYVKETYDKETASTLLRSYSAISKQFITRLQGLVDKKYLSANDVQFVKEMITTYELLAGEAAAYVEYLESDDESHLDTYNENRNAAWAKIETLLDLK